MSEPDAEHGRIIITVSRFSDRLFAALAARFGVERIAVRVDPSSGPFRSVRHADTTPYYGGAKISIPLGNQACTSAFAFTLYSYNMMVTAGHCAAQGGDVFNGQWPGVVVRLGNVVPNTRENWDDASGTVAFPTPNPYHGDLAFIQIDADKNSWGHIYVGLASSEGHSPVKERWWRRAANGDQFCTGGISSGEQCGWVVDTPGAWVQRGTNVWSRNAVTAHGSPSQCAVQGDSGAPVYTVRPDSGIAAKGILGGSKWWTSPCQLDFTDIYEVSDAWPGAALKTAQF